MNSYVIDQKWVINNTTQLSDSIWDNHGINRYILLILLIHIVHEKWNGSRMVDMVK